MLIVQFKSILPLIGQFGIHVNILISFNMLTYGIS